MSKFVADIVVDNADVDPELLKFVSENANLFFDADVDPVVEKLNPLKRSRSASDTELFKFVSENADFFSDQLEIS